MNVQLEKKEKNMAVLTVETEAEEFVKALDEAYKKDRNRISVPGFRKGKAPRKFIEKMYGKGIFYEDAANIVLRNTYDKAAKESGETIVTRPTVTVKQMEEGQPFIYEAEVALKPVITLGQYKGVEVPRQDYDVTAEEVDAEVDKEREKNARTLDVDDRPVQKGDQVKIDFEGSIDGEPFEGGKGENTDLTIGSGAFIPGFEDQVIGHSIGEEFDINVKFPEDYHAENLKGKDATFKCKVNAISVKELPAADDDFAQDVSEFDTLEEYKKDVEKKLAERKKETADRKKESAALEAASKNAQVEIPDAMIEEQAERMLDDFAKRIQQQGITMEQYKQFTGMDDQKLLDQMKPEAETRIRQSLLLDAVVDAEKIEISDERIDEEITKMAEQYKMEKSKLEEILTDDTKKQMKADLAVQAAAELIRDSAVEVEKPAEEEKPEAEEAGPELDGKDAE